MKIEINIETIDLDEISAKLRDMLYIMNQLKAEEMSLDFKSDTNNIYTIDISEVDHI